MKIRYDAKVDALYIELRPLEPGAAECRELTPDITAGSRAGRQARRARDPRRLRSAW